MPIAVASASAEKPSRARVAGAFANERRDRPAEPQRLPEVEPDGLLQPRDVLLDERKIDAEALALGQEDRPVGAEPIVGRSQAGEHQRRRGHQQDQERGKHRAAEHEAREAAVHVLSLFRLKSASALRGE